MSFEPPDLDKPFSGPREKTEVLSRILDLSVALEAWRDSAASGGLTDSQRLQLLSHLGDYDTPERKLRVWANLFADELSAVLSVRNGIIHGRPIGAKDLRAAEWLANRLLEYLQPADAA